MLHFLHISKTGGTAVKAAFRKSRCKGLKLHPHSVCLTDIPRGEGVIFFVRDPVTRFVSGFYSRLRQGRPLRNMPWTPPEAIAFSKFATPDALASALSAADEAEKAAARSAMVAIRHVSWSYGKWFGTIETFEDRVDDMVFVGLQEELGIDFERLKQKVGAPRDMQLPKDDVKSNKTPDAMSNSLSERAVKNLEEWYAKDTEFYERCKAIRQRQI